MRPMPPVPGPESLNKDASTENSLQKTLTRASAHHTLILTRPPGNWQQGHSGVNPEKQYLYCHISETNQAPETAGAWSYFGEPYPNYQVTRNPNWNCRGSNAAVGVPASV